VKKNDSDARNYSDEDIAFIEFINDLKKMGLSLEEMIHFGKEGCISEIRSLISNAELRSVLEKRLEVLESRLRKLDEERKAIERNKKRIIDRMHVYKIMLNKPHE
jgi:DNA-binding transcriptional MerR regulator